MKLKIKTEKVIELSDWDSLVQETYGRPYSFQQQDGCQDRGNFYLTVPDDAEDFENDTIPEIVNGPIEGVSFKAWLSRDPKQELESEEKGIKKDQWAIDLWWDGNFYPNIQMVANDLCERGLLDAGDYTININW